MQTTVPKEPRAAETLGDALPYEIARCKKLVAIYDSLPGGVGKFGSMMISEDIKEAEEAIATGDTVAMLRCYVALKGNEG